MRLMLALICSISAHARPSRPILIKAAHLFDGKGDSVVSPGAVLVKEGKILAVGKDSMASAGAEIIDLGNATLLPGLIDAHTHLSAEITDDWKQDELDSFKKPLSQIAIESTERANKTLAAGFTAVRDLGSTEHIDIGLRNAINAGKVPGPRIQAAGYAIGALGGHCDLTDGYRANLLKMEPDPSVGIATGPDQVRAAVRNNVKYGADVIKICVTGGVLSPQDKVDSSQMTQAEIDASVEEAHALGRKTAAHAHGNEGAKRAIRAGIDSIEHGTFMDDDSLAMMRTKGIYLVATPILCMRKKLPEGTPPEVVAKAKAAIETLDSLTRRAIQKGVLIAFGSDAGVCPHGSQGAQFAYLVDQGMKPAAAIRTATSVNAELLGWSDRIGSLEAGKFADIVAVPGNPLDDIHQMEKIFFVVKGGSVVRNNR